MQQIHGGMENLVFGQLEHGSVQNSDLTTMKALVWKNVCISCHVTENY